MRSFAASDTLIRMSTRASPADEKRPSEPFRTSAAVRLLLPARMVQVCGNAGDRFVFSPLFLALLVLILLLLTACPAHAESVAMRREHGIFVVPVLVNRQITLGFIVDSGAADVTIPADVVSTLIRAGTIAPTDYRDVVQGQLADGSVTSSQEIRLRSLRIGRLEIRNVNAMVTPSAGSLLLGESFLTRLPSWTVDNQHHLLILGAGKSESDWQLLGRSHNGGVTLYVDMSSIRGSNLRSVWLKAVYAPHTERGIGDKSEKWVDHEFLRDEFDCVERKDRSERDVWYYEDGSESEAPHWAESPRWEAVIPESAASKEMQMVCGDAASPGR